MKLSQLTTDNALDALCRLTPYLSNITTDQEFVEEIGKIVDGKGLSLFGQYTMMMERITVVLPILLQKHRPDVYGVLSVLNDKTEEEIAAQTVMETMGQLRELFQDKELLDFLGSFMPRKKKG